MLGIGNGGRREIGKRGDIFTNPLSIICDGAGKIVGGKCVT